MEKSELEIALNEGRNLVLVGGKVMALSKVTSRPTNCIDITRLDSGKGYICPPDQVKAVIGTVDLSALPWNRIGASAEESEEGEANSNGVPTGCLAMALTTKAGERIEPGAKVKLVNGSIGTYLGVNPRAAKYSVFFKTPMGQVRRCTRDYITALAA